MTGGSDGRGDVADGRRPRRRRPWARWLAVVIGGSMFVAAACGGGGGDDDGGDGGDAALEDPGDCLVVDVASSPEKLELLGDLAESFNESDQAELGDDCIFVRVQRKSSGAAEQQLARGWDESVDGPSPVIWSPAASSWGAVLNQHLADAGQPVVAPENPTAFMRTPLVIAMPRPMAEALGWPDTPIGWADVLALARDRAGWSSKGHPEWGAFRLGKTNPNFSTSGLSALIAQAYAATGKTTGLSGEDLADPAVDAFAKGVESAVVHYGDTTLTFLNNWYRADQRGNPYQYVSAVPVGEPISEANGVDPAPPQTLLDVPEPEVLAGLLDDWATQRKSARVLLVIDVSGSMGEPGDPDTGATKLDLAKDAAVAALEEFKDDDEVGLWIFSTELGDNADQDVLELLPPTRVGDVREQLSELISTLEAGSEGQASRPVRVFPIAYGSDADLPTLRQIADATSAAVYDSSDPTSIQQVFTAVVSNF